MSNETQDREPSSTTDSPGRRPRYRLGLALLVAAILLAGFLIPPLVNLGRFKNRITHLMAASFGRPVRLSSVQLRLLPWPGFVLTDLSVAEDPAYGSEPVLHANTVTANIRLLSLWRGRLEISSVSVDEASLNVVRAGPGRWNLDPLFRTAASQPGAATHAARLPYLEATNSRINFKDGAEKLPYSLMNTDLSFWQETPTEWRIRLRGQPARTDVSLNMADTGILQLEASVGRAPALHLMPIHADVEWREAQLGQLSRLLVGSDNGWRGDLTGELHLNGTPAAAQVTARLQATGVHRAEFAPNSPLDFDANCRFVYHYGGRALENLACDSPLGDGRVRVTGNLRGGDSPPELTAELNQIPVAAGLDVVRTMRSGIDPSLEASGTISGKLVYGPGAEPAPRQAANARAAAPRAAALTGSLTVSGFALSGGDLSLPLRAPRFVLAPSTDPGDAGREALAGTMSFQLGGTGPLDAVLRLGLNGYEAEVRGQASVSRAREIGATAGIGGGAALAGLDGEPVSVNLAMAGPWLPPQDLSASSGGTAVSDAAPQPPVDRINGTVTFHHAKWQANFLADPVEIAQGTLHIAPEELRWDPVDFSYGPLKGTATLTLPQNCSQPAGAVANAQASCSPHFAIQFGTLNAAIAQAAFLGARRSGTLLSELIGRFRSEEVPSWPGMRGTLNADTLEVGPVALRQVSAALKVTDNVANFSALRAGLLGGQLSAHGAIRWAGGDQPSPSYSIGAECKGISPPALGKLLGLTATGGSINAGGTLDLSGFTPRALAASAQGTVHFDWRRGAIGGTEAAPASIAEPARTELIRFDRWTGEAQVADNGVTLGKNQLISGAGTEKAQFGLTFGKPARVHLSVERGTQPQKPE